MVLRQNSSPGDKPPYGLIAILWAAGMAALGAYLAWNYGRPFGVWLFGIDNKVWWVLGGIVIFSTVYSIGAMPALAASLNRQGIPTQYSPLGTAIAYMGTVVAFVLAINHTNTLAPWFEGWLPVSTPIGNLDTWQIRGTLACLILFFGTVVAAALMADFVSRRGGINLARAGGSFLWFVWSIFAIPYYLIRGKDR